MMEPFETEDKLFDVKERSRVGPKWYAEPSYVYYDQSARLECGHARALLEDWFALYPQGGKAELRSRLQSDNEQNFTGAFFELYCYTLLARQGFSGTLHPTMTAGMRTHPDFLSYQQDEPAFYLESKVAMSRDYQTEARLHQLYDHLNRLSSLSFLLDVRPIGDIPNDNPPIKQIRRELDVWLKSLDPDDVLTKVLVSGHTALPTYSFWQGKWHIEFDALPLLPHNRGRVGNDMRIVGSMMHIPSSTWVDMQQPLLAALNRKRAQKYGEFSLPYIICVNVRSEPISDDNMAAALFGKTGIVRDTRTRTWSQTFIPPGFWASQRGPRETKVSCVLIVSLLSPLTIAQQTPLLWHNPWAINPLDPELWQGPQMVPDRANGALHLRDGKKAWELFDLDPSWPYISA